MAITLRPLDKDDIPALARLYFAAQEADDTGEHYNEADLEEEFDNPDIELGKDIGGAFDDSRLVGYWSTMLRKSSQDRTAYGFGMTAVALFLAIAFGVGLLDLGARRRRQRSLSRTADGLE